MKANETKPIPLQYAATTSQAGYRRLEAAMLQMGHLRNALIRHRNVARGSHRHAFTFNLQNAHLTDLHRNDPDFNSYARRLLESVAREVNKSYSTYFKHRTARSRPTSNRKPVPQPNPRDLRTCHQARQGQARQPRRDPHQGTAGNKVPNRPQNAGR